jgi:hypothetical protein
MYDCLKEPDIPTHPEGTQMYSSLLIMPLFSKFSPSREAIPIVWLLFSYRWMYHDLIKGRNFDKEIGLGFSAYESNTQLYLWANIDECLIYGECHSLYSSGCLWHVGRQNFRTFITHLPLFLVAIKISIHMLIQE